MAQSVDLCSIYNNRAEYSCIMTTVPASLFTIWLLFFVCVIVYNYDTGEIMHTLFYRRAILKGDISCF